MRSQSGWPAWVQGLLCCGLIGSAAAAGPALLLPEDSAAAQGVSQARLARLDAFLTAATQPGGHLGAVALVARNGRVVLWRAYGHSDLARSAPMARDAIVRIYSMTKPVVAVAALMLLEEGRLTLDDPVARHLPAFAAVRVLDGGTADAPRLRAPLRPVTIRHLLTHTAGLATDARANAEATRLLQRAQLAQSADLADFAGRVSQVPLAIDPGARFSYDGVNTEVLSRVVEVAGGQALDVFLQQRIFGPLGMADTGFAVPPAQRGRIAEISTTGRGGTLVRAQGRSSDAPGTMLNPYVSGAGGLYSTAADYLRLCQMLLNGGTLDGVRLLSRKTVELMLGNQLPQMDPLPGLVAGEGFGLGGSVVIDAARRGRLGSVGAFGWSGAASTYFTIDPREQLVAMVLAQHLPGDDGQPDLPKLNVTFFNLVYQALD